MLISKIESLSSKRNNNNINEKQHALFDRVYFLSFLSSIFGNVKTKFMPGKFFKKLFKVN